MILVCCNYNNNFMCLLNPLLLTISVNSLLDWIFYLTHLFLRIQSCMKVFPGQYPLWVYMEGSSCNTPLKGGKYLSIIHLCLVHEEEIKIQQATGELYMVILLDPILLERYRRSHHALGRHRSISCKPIFDLMWISNKRHLVRYYYYCHTSRQQ